MKTVTHTAYVFDDGLGTPLEVRVWNIAGDPQPERHQITFVVEIADDCFIALTICFDMCRPFAYVFVLGHIARFGQMKVVDARRIHKVRHPHEEFRHMLEVFVQHVFFTKQLAAGTGAKHEREEEGKVEGSSGQRRRVY